MTRTLEQIAALPRDELLSCLRKMPIPLLRRFRKAYSFGDRSQGRVADLPFEAHFIILSRCDPDAYGDEQPAVEVRRHARRRRHSEHYRKKALA